MGHEIDFLAVGEESSGGDAIALRYGDLTGNRNDQTVIVIDGGYKDCGQALVDHIKDHFGTDRVDVVVSTHPDQDHSSGLTVVLENLQVDALWMHLPWNHSTDVKSLRSQHFVSAQLSERVEKSLQSVSDLEAVANRLGVPIVEPFTGVQTVDGLFRVVGPTVERYEELLAEIAAGKTLAQRVMESLSKVAQAVRQLIAETISHETLAEGGTTSPRNNTSAITLLSADGLHSLFTGDAGIASLEPAAWELRNLGISAGNLNFVQIPHHGSRHNVGPNILNQLLGDPGQTATHSTAFLSAPKTNPDLKHPHKKVVNAFTRRGYEVHATQGTGKRHHHDAPDRPGWTAATPLPFYSAVEDDDD